MDFAGIPETSESGKILRDFSTNFGVCFQLADDVEDLQADTKEKEETDITKNVLHFMTGAEAKNKYVPQMQASIEALEKTWPSSSAGLAQMGNALLDRIV